MNFFAALFVSSTIIMTVVQLVFHPIEEGYVGVYYRGGALLPEVSHPGFHFMMPMLTVRKRIQITLRTNEVQNVSCGVSGGVLLIFDRIEVDSILSIESVLDIVRNYTADYAKILISDKIRHKLNQFCSTRSLQEVNIVLFDQIGENLRNTLQRDLDEMAPGLKIQAVRVTKPYIPHLVRKFYEKMEEQRTKLLIATEHQKVVEKDAETDRKKAAIEAETEAYIARIRYGQKLMEKQALQEIAQIEDSMYLAAEQNKADANFYRVRKQAEANFFLLTPTYMELKKNEALNNNTILYYGPNIPKMFVVDSWHVNVTKVEVGKDDDS